MRRPAISLRNRREIQGLFRRGKRVITPFFHFVVQRNIRSSHRIVIVMRRSVDKRAVVRNRIKRRIKEWFRHHRSPMGGGYLDCAIIPQSAVINISRKQFYEELEKGVQKFIRAPHA